jgi:hypothetical protein
MALDAEWSASRNDGFSTVEKSSGNALDIMLAWAQSKGAMDKRKVYPIKN